MPEISESTELTSKNAHWHRPDRVKRCISCEEEKPLGEFYAYAYTTSQGKRSTRYESRCKPCSIERRKERSVALPGYDAAKSMEWRERNRDQMLSYRREYQASEHGRRVRARNQRLRKALMRSGSRADDPRIAEIYQEAMDWEKKLAACVISDEPLELKMHVDHVMPLSKGGQHVFENLQILDALENMRKGARLDYA